MQCFSCTICSIFLTKCDVFDGDSLMQQLEVIKKPKGALGTQARTILALLGKGCHLVALRNLGLLGNDSGNRYDNLAVEGEPIWLSYMGTCVSCFNHPMG
jgi:hypothetical protein